MALAMALAASLAAACLTASGCGRNAVLFVSEERSYELETVEDLHTSVQRPAIEGRPVTESSVLRRDTLVELRSRGSEAVDAAEFITRSLPDNGRSVPYYVESAEIDGLAVWILLELWGPAEGTLENTRLWVFDRNSGDILYSSTQR